MDKIKRQKKQKEIKTYDNILIHKNIILNNIFYYIITFPANKKLDLDENAHIHDYNEFAGFVNNNKVVKMRIIYDGKNKNQIVRTIEGNNAIYTLHLLAGQ